MYLEPRSDVFFTHQRLIRNTRAHQIEVVTKKTAPNFTTFLKELQEAFVKDGSHYEISFTIPTSYWYLRWFDLKAVEHVDFINVMSMQALFDTMQH